MSARDHLSDYLLGELARRRARALRGRARAPTRRSPPRSSGCGPSSRGSRRSSRRRGSRRRRRSAAAAAGAARRPRRRARAGGAGPLVLRPLPAAALAALLLALGVAAGLLLGGRRTATARGGGRVIALAPVEPLGGAGDRRRRGCAATASGRRVHLTGLAPEPRRRLLRAVAAQRAGRPRLARLVHACRRPARSTSRCRCPAARAAFAALDVSVEPADGDPAHSSRSVLRAPLAPS